MADDRIVIEIELDDGTIKKGFARIEDQAQKTGEQVASNLEKGTSKFSATGLIATGAAIVGAFKAAQGAVRFLTESVRAASEENDAINRLNIALGQTGQFSEEASKGLVDYSNALQATTKFSNDAILNSAALIQSLGKLDQDGLQRATKATLDLSTALGIDLNAASTLVGKAAAGNVESFSRYGLQIQKGKTDTETFANALKALEERFGGASEAAAKTFSGALVNLENVFGDFQEQIGKFISQSPAIVAAINAISKIINDFGNALSKSFGNRDIFKQLILDILSIAQPVIEVGNIIFNVFNTAFNAVQTGVQGLVAGFAQGVLFIANIGNKIGAVSDETLGKIRDFADGSKEILIENANATATSVANVFDTSLSQPVVGALETIKVAVQETNGTLNEFGNVVANTAVNAEPALTKLKIGIADIKKNASTLGDTFNLIALGVTESANKMAEEGSAAFKKLGDTALKGFASAVGSAFAQFGSALAKGENAFKAFTKAFIASIGQAAVALGTEFILRGTAYLFVPGLQSLGGPLIAAGAALATFGGVLSAVGGGGDASTGANVGAGSTSGGQFGVTGDLPENVTAEPRGPEITLNVQGDVLDSESTGLRIVDILREFTDKNGDVITA